MDRLLQIMRAALADARRRGAWDEYAIVLLGIARLIHMEDLASLDTVETPALSRAERSAA